MQFLKNLYCINDAIAMNKFTVAFFKLFGEHKIHLTTFFSFFLYLLIVW